MSFMTDFSCLNSAGVYCCHGSVGMNLREDLTDGENTFPAGISGDCIRKQ